MLLPDDISKKNTEHGHQAALICFVNMPPVRMAYPGINKLFAIPNGGARDAGTGAMMKAEGVKPGVPDLFLPQPSRTFAGLFIEMKKPGEQTTKNGGLSERQVEVCNMLHDSGYRVEVCYSWREAAVVLVHYLKHELLTDSQINAMIDSCIPVGKR